MKMYLSAFLVFSLVLFLAQFGTIDVSDQPDIASKFALLIRSVNWFAVLGVVFTAVSLMYGASLLKYTPIGKILDSRDE